MPKDLVASDGAVAWSASHSAYGRIVSTYADPDAQARYGTAVKSPFRLLGQIADEDAELCWTRFRCFDPETGTWMSTDPLEIEGGLNLYGFDGAPTRFVDPRGLSVIRSRIHDSDTLVKEAKETGKSHQKSIDRLTEELSKGNLNPGIGTKPIGQGISEARARDGARVYFRQDREGNVEILGKSNKANQQKVINEVLRVFG